MKKLSILIGLLVFIASCSSNEEEESVMIPYKPLKFSAVSDIPETSDAETRAHGAYVYEIRWDAQDQIKVKDATNNIDLFSLTDGADTRVGYFAQMGQTPLSGSIEAYYPSTLLQDDGSLIWPSEITYSSKMTGLPMRSTLTLTGSEEKIQLGFKSLGGVLQLLVSTDVPNIVLDNIVVSAKEAGLSGQFEVVNDAASNLSSDNKFKINFGDQGLNISDVIQTVNIYLPPVTKREFTLDLATKNGEHGFIVVSGAITRNVVNRLLKVVKSFVSPFLYTCLDGNQINDQALSYWDNTYGLASSSFENGEGTILTKNPIVEIGPSCFSGARLKTVTLPSTVKTLATDAFANMTTLTEINLNEGLETLSYGCLSNTGLEEIIIPSSVKTIGSGILNMCERLTTVEFKSKTPPVYSGDQFVDCDNLETIIVPSESYGAYKAFLVGELGIDEDEIEIITQ